MGYDDCGLEDVYEGRDQSACAYYNGDSASHNGDYARENGVSESQELSLGRDRDRDMRDRPESDDGLTGLIWEKHVFVCTSGEWCARIDGDGLGVHAALKQQVSQAGLKGRVRVNHSGCLDQCGNGPMVVVYPDGVWYSHVQPGDVEEIVREHLVGGRPVTRLVYRNHPGKNKLARDEQGRPVQATR